MGDSASWARDQEREAEARKEEAEADALREKIVTEWGEWSLEKMKMVKVISELEWGDEKKMLVLMENFHNLQVYLQIQRKIAKGDL
jgi:hypothetical protein